MILGDSWQLIFLVGALDLFAVGAISALLTAKTGILSEALAFLCSVLASGCLIGAAICGLAGGSERITLLNGSTAFTNIEFGVNAFSSLFLLIIGAIGLMAAIYATGYVAEYRGRKSVALLNAGMLIFLMAMAGVVTAANVFTFLLAWEIMSIVSYFLVVFEHEKPEAQKAGFIYVVMTHVGTIFLTVSFFVLQHYSGSFEFREMGQAALPPAVKSLIFVCALIGFGTKAGLVPLHIWLPRAHPSAPSHISALMSGVMIKTAIYGFLLVVLDFLHIGPLWWGVVVLIVGCITAIYGVLHALSEADQKRMLAFSSVENIGLMFMGIGAALLFTTLHQPVLAAFALLAVLYHLLNHAFFKSLLFMGAGAVLSVTHTKNMNLYGGLIRRMPWTALFVLAGSLAIAAMPPFNGFVGEWLLFQSLFTLSFTAASVGMHVLGALAIAALTITGALVAFLFVRSFATTFLAMPRSEHAEHAHETPVSMRLGMGVLAVCCLLLGVLPFAVYDVIRKAVEAVTGTVDIPVNTITAANMASSGNRIATATTLLVICGGLVLAWLLSRLIGGKTRRASAETWACGNVLKPRMMYTASGFSKPVRVAFQPLLKPSRRLIIDRDPQNPYFIRGYTYISRIPLILEEFAYAPAMRVLVAGAHIFRKIQNGQVQSYLVYLFATLVLVLVLVMR